jgi:hypothetical protein
MALSNSECIASDDQMVVNNEWEGMLKIGRNPIEDICLEGLRKARKP